MSTAITWLLDVVPPDYRMHGVLRRHPLALAVLARHHLAACVQGAREGYRTARTELASLPPGGVDAVLEVYQAEGRRLVETARAVDLVGRALRGEVFTPRLGAQERSAQGKGAARTGAARTGAARTGTAATGTARTGTARTGTAPKDAPPTGTPAKEPAPDKGRGAGRRAAKPGRPR